MSGCVDSSTLTLIDGEKVSRLDAAFGENRIRLRQQDVAAVLGWEVKTQGLCRGDTCIPIRDPGTLLVDGAIDLQTLSDLLDRPLAADAAERVAVLGVAAAERQAALGSVTAPDFTLPDLEGTPHALATYRGKKVLLIAWASW